MVYLLGRSDFELGRDFCAAQAKLRAWELCSRYCDTSWPGPFWIFPIPLTRQTVDGNTG